MRPISIALLVALPLALAATADAQPTSTPTAPTRAATETPVDSTERFELWSDFELNLHHFLYQWATSTDEGKRRRLPISEADALDTLEPLARQNWEAAIGLYQARIIDRNLLFDEGMVAVRDTLTGKRAKTGLEGPGQVVPTILGTVAETYRNRWWPAHDAANRALIAALAPKLRRHEATLAAGLAEAYGGSVPPAPVRVDVSAYANTVGGYTTSDAHIVISSSNPTIEMPQALELVFHELSHADPLERPLLEALDQAFAASEAAAPEDLWHMMIFYTAGELTRRVLTDDYTTIAEEAGMFTRRPARKAYLAALDAHWKPFLAGETKRPAALRRIAADLVAAGAAEPAGTPRSRRADQEDEGK